MSRRIPEIAIDVGGTFTDSVAVGADGALVTDKVASSGRTRGHVGEAGPWGLSDPARRADPDGFWVGATLRVAGGQSPVVRFDRQGGRLEVEPPLAAVPVPGQPYEIDPGQEAPIVAIRRILGIPLGAPVPEVRVRLGTTRGTNALLTRTGARTALVTTLGFGDVLHIGNQDRPRLFELEIRKRAVLFERVVQVDERLDATGAVLRPPDLDRLRADLEALRSDGIESLAICLLHAYRNPRHESLVEEVARAVGFEEISASSVVAPRQKVVGRAETAVLDAYLGPVLRRYVAGLRSVLGQSKLQIMTSAGGLVDAGRFTGKDSVLSGPAGGAVGYAAVARAAGFTQAIGLDMGGTSTDVSRWGGEIGRETESEKAGVRIVVPTVAIETVAAGGGSICRFDGVRLRVGPESAGSDPGPACYGRGGPLTVTDCNLLLGRIPTRRFPFPLDREAAEARLAELAARVPGSPLPLAEGLIAIANAHMVHAIGAISVHRGYDPAEHVLVPFGAAAGQHACALARELSIGQVLAHPHAGVLSALGLLLADVRVLRERSVLLSYGEDRAGALEPVFADLEREARAIVLSDGIPADRLRTRRQLDLRYVGVDASLAVDEPGRGTWAEAYEREHLRTFGYRHEGRALEIVTARVEVVGCAASGAAERVRQAPATTRRPVPDETTAAWFGGRSLATGMYLRESLSPGDVIDGPAIVCERTSTLVVDPGWQARVTERDDILLTDRAPDRRCSAGSSLEADAVGVEIWQGRFGAIAERMGIVLRRTAGSTNVKERLDYSCALFTAEGDLVVNAPHIPVHLGAMSDTVRRIVADHPDLGPGDVYVTNDPTRGGSHLPDVTVVTPVHLEGRLSCFVASRAHHAEIGGITPGSMPAFSRSLAEEGVLIASLRLVERGVSRQDELAALLRSGPWPSRAVGDNLADVAAQVAANRTGVAGLEDLATRHSRSVVLAWMQHVQASAAAKVRAALAALPGGRRSFVDHLDDGTPIAVALTIEGERAIVDFWGTGPVVPGNLNANPAIVTAAVIYVFRCLLDEDIPLNGGVLQPLAIRVPRGSLLCPPAHEDPSRCAAVAGGNVETSQRVVDVLLGALGRAAASQGTMNNLSLGDETFGYYETLCGGAGATARAPGADAVHTHMTNTRLTDPEVLELRAPVRLVRFAIRRGSGGAGRHRGGDGASREIELLRPLRVSIVSERRGPFPPWGLEGGGPGALGRNLLYRSGSATAEVLPAKIALDLGAGDRLVIETPGGGGWGAR